MSLLFFLFIFSELSWYRNCRNVKFSFQRIYSSTTYQLHLKTTKNENRWRVLNNSFGSLNVPTLSTNGEIVLQSQPGTDTTSFGKKRLWIKNDIKTVKICHMKHCFAPFRFFFYSIAWWDDSATMWWSKNKYNRKKWTKQQASKWWTIRSNNADNKRSSGLKK